MMIQGVLDSEEQYLQDCAELRFGQGHSYVATEPSNHTFGFPGHPSDMNRVISPACESYPAMDPKLVDLSLPVPPNDFGYHYDQHYHAHQHNLRHHTRGSDQYHHQAGVYYLDQMASQPFGSLRGRNISQSSFQDDQDPDNASWEPDSVSNQSRTPKKTRKAKKQRGARADAAGSVGSNEEAQDDKRKRFLERNRLAASKCRQKKKIWMQELESKSSEIFQRNRDLQALTSQLKQQVEDLKAQLQMYANCQCGKTNL